MCVHISILWLLCECFHTWCCLSPLCVAQRVIKKIESKSGAPGVIDPATGSVDRAALFEAFGEDAKLDDIYILFVYAYSIPDLSVRTEYGSANARISTSANGTQWAYKDNQVCSHAALPLVYVHSIDNLCSILQYALAYSNGGAA